MKHKAIGKALSLLLTAGMSCASAFAQSSKGEITLIHMGDVHGHLIERPNVRSDGNGEKMGGLARMYTLIKDIRSRHPGSTITVNGGDTVQGSAEAMFTKGEAMIEVLNKFLIDVDNPGNKENNNEPEDFLKQFAGPSAQFRANAIAANLYYDGPPYQSKNGQLVLEPYWIKEINGLKLVFIGFTAKNKQKTNKTEITKGLKLSDGEAGGQE